MAPNDFFQIKQWEAPDANPNIAELVGASPQPPQLTATRVAIGEDGRVEFKEEVPIEVVSSRNLDLSTDVAHHARPPQLTNTIEVKCPAKVAGAKHTVVICAYPYGFDWFARSQLKPGLYDVVRHNPGQCAFDLIHKLQTAADPQKVLDDAEFDPFERRKDKEEGKRKRWLTARFIGPFERTPGSHVTLRYRNSEGRAGFVNDLELSDLNRLPRWETTKKDEMKSVLAKHGGPAEEEQLPDSFWNTLSLGGEIGNAKRRVSPVWLWGLCEDFEACRHQLRSSPEAQDMVQNPEQVLSNASWRMKRPSHQLVGGETYFWKVASSMMDAAVFKALAGMPPPSRMPAVWRNAKRKFVIELVINIFQDSMLNLAKRLGSRESFDSQIKQDNSSEPAAPPLSADSFTGYKTVEECEEDWRARFRKVQLNDKQIAAIFDLAISKLESEDEPKIVEGCGMVAAAVVQKISIPKSVVVLLQKMRKKQTSDYVGRSMAYVLQKLLSRN